jgi:putative ABC transport system permease protein
MSGEPGGFHDGYSFESEAKPDDKMLFSTEFTDLDFVKTLGLKIIAGRDLSESFTTDSAQAVLINRNAANKLGYTPEQAVGKWIRNVSRDSLRRTIVGVVEDYHYVSLKDPIGPLVISPGRDRRLALIRLKTDRMQSTIASIKKVYTASAPDYPFEYKFLDDNLTGIIKQKQSNRQCWVFFLPLQFLSHVLAYLV